MTPPAAAATVREGAPWGEMSPFVHPTPGMAAVALPPATWQAAAEEPAPLDEAPDAARRSGVAREFRCST